MIREFKKGCPFVSVIIITYNQAKYIREALDSFLSQKTDFEYEILIHDDCSSDGTQEILKEYEAKYPDKVYVFYEEENQYSKGIHTMFAIMFPFARGKYITLCEGDDYYCDLYKLQKQYNAMEGHPECRFCVHRVKTVWEDGSESGISIPKSIHHDTIIQSADFLNMVKDYEFQTGSYMFRTEDAMDFITPIREFVKIADVGDECYQLFFGRLGSIVYLEDTLVCHRAGSNGSWNQRNKGEKRIRHYERMINMMIEYDKFTNYEYHQVCEDYILHQRYQIVLIKNDYRAMLKKDFRKYFKSYSLKRKAIVILKALTNRD